MEGIAQLSTGPLPEFGQSGSVDDARLKVPVERRSRARLGPRQLVVRGAILAAYGLAFTLLRAASASWATHVLFSVWFPAAGLRFAFLWVAGPRWAPALAMAELLVSVGTGTVALSSDLALSLAGIVGPCLVYGAVIALVRARTQQRGDEFDPMAFAIAAVLGPMAACIAALPWALPLSLSQHQGPSVAPLLFSALLVFSLGDLLGILVLAPPLLWLVHRLRTGSWSASIPKAGQFAELTLALGCAWGLVWLLHSLGDGLVLAPVLLAACWCGLRGGRPLAWVAIVTSAIVVLPMSGDGVSDAIRVQLHMQLACVAVGAYLAGSYADAQARAMVEIGRRDRLLFQAERLKTLRAMSVAVIHEVSQPLSTIAIEAQALVEGSKAAEPNVGELRDIASIVARKADHLAEMIRRLRAFGSAANEGRDVHSVRKLVADVLSLVAPEARKAGVRIHAIGGPDLKASVNDVEIRQAMLNLVRNAIAAAPKPGGVISVSWSQAGSSVCVQVENPVGNSGPGPGGMGLGLIISRTIAQAHGGSLTLERTAAGFRSVLQLPFGEGFEA